LTLKTTRCSKDPVADPESAGGLEEIKPSLNVRPEILIFLASSTRCSSPAIAATLISFVGK
jgi:hypothetical protein